MGAPLTCLHLLTLAYIVEFYEETWEHLSVYWHLGKCQLLVNCFRGGTGYPWLLNLRDSFRHPQWWPGGGTHYMKVTTYAPPFRPPFFRSLENLYSFDPYILAKMRKMSYFDPYFSSKLGKMYSFDPPFLTLVAFRVDGRCWASLSKTRPSTPPGNGGQRAASVLTIRSWPICQKRTDTTEPAQLGFRTPSIVYGSYCSDNILCRNDIYFTWVAASYRGEARGLWINCLGLWKMVSKWWASSEITPNNLMQLIIT